MVRSPRSRHPYALVSLLLAALMLSTLMVGRAVAAPPSASETSAVDSLAAVPQVLVDVYRFYSPRTGAHFYTADLAERNHIIATLSGVYIYEGVAYTLDTTAQAMNLPLYRFYNTKTGTHFYTLSPAERDHVRSTFPQFNYEGPAYYVSGSPIDSVPVYRFYNARTGAHFYTAGEAEKNIVMQTLPMFSYEGPAFYLASGDYVEPEIAITGVTDTVAGALSGTVAAGFTLPTTNVPAIDHELSLATGSVSSEPLADAYTGLTLVPEPGQVAALEAYYASKPEPWKTYLVDAANGLNPFVYLKTTGTTLSLVDAAQHDIGSVDNPMTVPDDFPLGTYTVAGTVTDAAGNTTPVALKLIVVRGYTVTATGNANGTVTPSTSTVPFGTDVSITITPHAGYYLDELTLDGVAVAPQTPYAVPDVAADHTVVATFAPYAPVWTVDAQPTLADVATPGAWIKDRSAPAGFESVDLGGENVLKLSVAAAGFRADNDWYNTMGRKYLLPNVQEVSADVYLPAGWATGMHRVGVWATAVDGVGAAKGWPIVDFYNDGTTATFRVWDNFGWHNVTTPVAYGQWYNFRIQRNANTVTYYIDDALVYASWYSADTEVGTSIGFSEMILQSKNFNADDAVYFDNVVPVPNP